MRVILKIGHGISYFFYIFLYWLFVPFALIFVRPRKIWIISERGYDARDNGYHFFKYLNSNHKNINCFYAIHKKSSDYKNIKEYTNVLEFGSLKHIFYFAGAVAKISSTVNGFAPNKYYAKYMLKRHLLGKNIGLKHGIFKNIHPNYFKNNSHLDLIICGAYPEYEFVKNNFNYLKNEVAYCGLARFDRLHDFETKKQILIMPTFRIPLAGLDDEQFIQTEYFKRWDELLNLLDKQISSDISVIFYIHAVFQKFAHLFENRYQHIIIAKFSEYDVQALLKESKLLITDFSSVFFDFAYMKKPTIYYQFDEEFFNENHYKKGYFDYRIDGFGKVVISCNECLRYINETISSDFNIEDEYLNRINHFFILHDKNNCERIYNEIVKII